MGLMAFDPARLDTLRVALGAALDDLLRVRSDDSATETAMQTIRSARRSLADTWLPRVNDVLHSTSMTASFQTKLDDGGRASPASSASTAGPLWNLAADPEPSSGSGTPLAKMYGPELAGSKSFGEVLEGIDAGTLRAMAAPLDAQGRAGAHYTSLAIAPGAVREVGHADLTSGLLKFIDFWSDGLPVGWRETKGLTILYLSNARAVSNAHVLEAYDRDSGPEPLPGMTTEATVSGYLVLYQDSSTAEVSVQIGPGIQDPTESFPIISESSSSYSGVFYPDRPPDFQPITDQPRFVRPPAWTFTTSASPMVDGWGTYGI